MNVKNLSKLILLLIISLFIACKPHNDVSKQPSISGAIVDNRAWYLDENDDVIDMHVTIPEPNPYNCSPYDNQTAPVRPCTLEDVTHDLYNDDQYEPMLYGNMQSNNFSGSIEFKIRGDYSRTQEQKSYSVKLLSSSNLFLNQRRFQLAKQQSDRSRIKNKVAYKLFQDIPNITSVKTQFVHLYVNNIDYGLFTHLEAYRKEFLINRGWNEDDNLYNASNMFFDEWALEDTAVDEDGQPKDWEKFNNILEIKRGDNHSALQKMLQAINLTQDINEVIDIYFDRENYITWLAVNLVLSNKDTSYHNFYLYNPKYSQKFYFMPWDYDGAWARPAYLQRWEYGISVWWQAVLTKKFISVQKNRDELYAKAEELAQKYFTEEKIRSIVDAAENTVRPFQSVLPDSQNNSDSTWLETSQRLYTTIQDNIDLYKNTMGSPMPFWQKASYNNGFLTLTWDQSVDLEGDEIVYDVAVAKDANMSETVFVQNNIADDSAVADSKIVLVKEISLNPGTYYMKVTAKESNNPNNYQIAFNTAFDENDNFFEGVLRFDIN